LQDLRGAIVDDQERADQGSCTHGERAERHCRHHDAGTS
jgi:hypothetical protein